MSKREINSLIFHSYFFSFSTIASHLISHISSKMSHDHDCLFPVTCYSIRIGIIYVINFSFNIKPFASLKNHSQPALDRAGRHEPPFKAKDVLVDSGHLLSFLRREDSIYNSFFGFLYKRLVHSFFWFFFVSRGVVPLFLTDPCIRLA